MPTVDFQNALSRLKQEFVDKSAERLDEIDALIDRLHEAGGPNDAGTLADDFLEFQRAIHSLKGTAGSYGFNSVSLIAHRLEDYIEAVSRMSGAALHDIQLYVDQMREILRGGAEISADRLDQILRALPKTTATPEGTENERDVVVLLVMETGTWRSLATAELSKYGFELAFSDHPVEAFGLSISLKPDLIVSSVEFDNLSGIDFANALYAVQATVATPVVLMTSRALDQLHDALPPSARAIHKGPDFAADLARTLTEFATSPGTDHIAAA